MFKMGYLLQFLVTFLTEGSIYALLGLGIAIIHRTTEVMFFAQGALAMVSGVILYVFCAYSHVPLIFSIPICLAVSVTFAIASQWLVVIPLLNRGATHLSVSLVSFGILLILETAAMILFGKDPLAVPHFSGDEPIKVLATSIMPQDVWVVSTLVIFSCLFVLFFKRTWVGKAMSALGENPLLARASGFPIKQLFTYSFVFGGLLGGAAGILSAPTSYTGYWIGARLSIKGFVAAAVGGINNPLGAVIGGFIIAFFEAFGAGFVSSGAKDLITMVVLLLVIYFRPKGLMGEW